LKARDNRENERKVKAMECREVQDNLAAFKDNELDGSAREQVEAHLLRCMDCSRVYREMHDIAQIFADLEPPPVSEHYWDEMVQELEQENAGEAAPSFGERFSAWFGTLFSPAPLLKYAAALPIIALVAGISGWLLAERSAGTDTSMAQITVRMTQELQEARSVQQPAVYTSSVDRITFTDKNCRQIVYLIEKEPANQQCKLVRMIDGQRRVLYENMEPIVMEFTRRGKRCLEFSIQPALGPGIEGATSAQGAKSSELQALQSAIPIKMISFLGGLADE